MIAKPVLSIAMVAVGSLLIATARAPLPAGRPDPVRGSKLFLQCAACHSVTSGAPNAIGPNLSGVLNAKAGARPGYSYSPALIKSGLMWNAVTLDAFLKRPSQAVPGTKMAFGGVADPKARADLVAYLATLQRM